MKTRAHQHNLLDQRRLEREVELVIRAGGAYPARIVSELLLELGNRIVPIRSGPRLQRSGGLGLLTASD